MVNHIIMNRTWLQVLRGHVTPPADITRGTAPRRHRRPAAAQLGRVRVLRQPPAVSTSLPLGWGVEPLRAVAKPRRPSQSFHAGRSWWGRGWMREEDEVGMGGAWGVHG
jgi:hypothetical protein